MFAVITCAPPWQGTPSSTTASWTRSSTAWLDRHTAPWPTRGSRRTSTGLAGRRICGITGRHSRYACRWGMGGSAGGWREQAETGKRPVVFGRAAAAVPTAVYWRPRLGAGDVVRGPAVIEEYG